MIQHCNGPLGNFQYDDREFTLKDNCLHYIGTETDGSKIKIPKGIKDCNSMFYGCRSLVRAPEIPTGVINCDYMFDRCTSLIEAPEIPVGVTKCVYMFFGCSSLLNAPEIPAGVTMCYAMFYGCSSLAEAPTIPAGVTNCNYMFFDCDSLQNYSLDNATCRDEIYRNCPLVIQEIDSFIQKFKERKTN